MCTRVTVTSVTVTDTALKVRKHFKKEPTLQQWLTTFRIYGAMYML